jgi:hypothetical protein
MLTDFWEEVAELFLPESGVGSFEEWVAYFVELELLVASMVTEDHSELVVVLLVELAVAKMKKILINKSREK